MDNTNHDTEKSEKSEVNQSILPRKVIQVCALSQEKLPTPSFNKGHEYSVGDDCPYCLEDGNVRVYIRKHKSEKDQPLQKELNNFNLNEKSSYGPVVNKILFRPTPIDRPVSKERFTIVIPTPTGILGNICGAFNSTYNWFLGKKENINAFIVSSPPEISTVRGGVDEDFCDGFLKSKFPSLSQPATTGMDTLFVENVFYRDNEIVKDIIQSSKSNKIDPKLVKVVKQPALSLNVINTIYVIYNYNLFYDYNDAPISYSIFNRNEMKNLWNSLETNYSNAVLEFKNKSRFIGSNKIDGCPGVGKSLMVLSYGMYLATVKKTKVAICLFEGNKQVKIISFDQKENSLTSSVSTVDLIGSSYHGFTDMLVSFEVVILDGLTHISNDYKDYMRKLAKANVYTIVCSSLQLPELSSHDIELTTGHSIRTIVESWTYEDLKLAETHNFLKLKDSTLDEYYHYCGGSIRLYNNSIKSNIYFLKSKFDALNMKYF